MLRRSAGGGADGRGRHQTRDDRPLDARAERVVVVVVGCGCRSGGCSIDGSGAGAGADRNGGCYADFEQRFRFVRVDRGGGLAGGGDGDVWVFCSTAVIAAEDVRMDEGVAENGAHRVCVCVRMFCAEKPRNVYSMQKTTFLFRDVGVRKMRRRRRRRRPYVGLSQDTMPSSRR